MRKLNLLIVVSIVIMLASMACIMGPGGCAKGTHPATLSNGEKICTVDDYSHNAPPPNGFHEAGKALNR